jgi:hypothetical protein
VSEFAALLAFVSGNWWRTLALALLAFAMVQSLRIDTIKAGAESCKVQLADMSADVDEALQSASAWQASADDLRVRLQDMVNDIEVQRERDAAAVAKANASRAESDRVLAAWVERYAAAVRNPDCARVMEQRLCEI